MAAHDGKLEQGQKGTSQKVQAKTGASAQQISANRYEKVSDVYSSEKERKLVHITLAGGKSITATDGHPFRTSEGWRDAVLLKKGAKLLLMGSGEGDEDSTGIATIEDVRIEVKTVRVYNLEVENLHTFFVGVDGVVVHNAPRGSQWAGGKHPVTGVPFDRNGFPDFTDWAIASVLIKCTGNRAKDRRLANRAAGFDKTPEHFTWHHHQDGSMQLVDRYTHDATGHVGGFSINRKK